MPVRKLTRSGAGESCGGEEMVSGGMQQPDQEQFGGGQGRDELIDQLIMALLQAKAGGGDQNAGKQQQGQQKGGQAQKQQESDGASALAELCAQAPGSREPLERAAGEVLTALHMAKMELAQEMESNLKQLKAVLQETQRIAKNMEAVLKEAKGEQSPEEEAKGTAAKQGKQAQAKPWDPPGLKQEDDQGGAQGKKAGQKKKGDDQEEDDDPPSWSPPEMDDQQSQSHAH